MCDTLGVHVSETFDDLGKDLPCIVFRKISMGFESTEELTALAETK